MDKTIVWIENDTDIIDPVVKRLERTGYHFIRLHTVREALEAMDTMCRADLILLDVVLPTADIPYVWDNENALSPFTGLSLLHQLRQASASKTPVVVLTALRCPQLKRTLQGLEVADIVYMPIRPSELHRRLEAVCAPG